SGARPAGAAGAGRSRGGGGVCRSGDPSGGVARGAGARDAARARAHGVGGAGAGQAGPAAGGGGGRVGEDLGIVESPAKAKTLGKYLGRDFQVKASVGHVVDLPKSKLGVDIEKDFAADYQVIHGKAKVLTEIKAAAKDKENVYLAPDPDREGEAI